MQVALISDFKHKLRPAETALFYQFGEFRLDVAEETLRRNGEKLNINRRMFQVLQLLVERAGEIVSKEDFFETVWADSFVEDNNLTVAITGLRKVLGDTAKQSKFIENLPRKGYRFIGNVTVPDGALRTERRKTPPLGAIENRATPPFKTRKIWVAIFATGILFLVTAFGLNSLGYLDSALPSAKLATESVAVLPFQNQDPDTEYLSDGLTESVINNLAKLPNLRVISRNSVFRYKNKAADIQAVGRELGVRAVLSGRMVQLDDGLVVTAELVDIPTGKKIWEKQFTRQSADMSILHEELSREISHALRINLTSEQEVRFAKRETDSPEAYKLYLKGLYFWNKRTKGDFNKAVEFFRQAIDLDPTYARAYVGLANSYSLGSFDFFASDQVRAPTVVATAQKALDIDQNLGEAHATQGLMKSFFQWDWDGAERDYKLAIHLSPNYATAHHWYAELLAMQGRFDESFAEYNKASELDPLSLAIKTDLGITYYYAGQDDRAIEYLQKLKQIDPTYARTRVYLADVYRAKDMYAEAIEEYEKSYALNKENDQIVAARAATLRHSLQSSGPEGYWRAMLEFVLADTRRDGGIPGVNAALLYARLGDRDRVFECLEAAYAKRAVSLAYLKVKREFDAVRSDPRFQDLIHRVGLVR